MLPRTRISNKRQRAQVHKSIIIYDSKHKNIETKI